MATIGVFGGSGLYSFLDDAHQETITTPYGDPSGPVALGTATTAGGDEVEVAFLPRHGADHSIPPHRINFRANMWAFRELGVTRVLSPCAAGSLQVAYEPGSLVVADQIVDETRGRADTYFEGPVVHHVSLADPYCPEVRSVLLDAARSTDAPVHDGATCVVIAGPRFATRAESALYRQAGCHTINMTQYPEAALARELGLCFGTVQLITDYDTGVEGVPSVEAVTHEDVFAMFEANIPKVRATLQAAISAMPAERSCGCADAPGGVEPSPPPARRA